MSQKNFKVKNGLSVNGTEVIDANAQVDWTRLKNRVSATTAAAGEMAASDKSKLDGIENNATADQSPSEIRTAVASASDSNVFTDAQQTKLNNISTSADVTPIIDEDSMASNLATSVPSQQSTKAYVDAQVNGLVDAAPGTLNTLNELAAALGDDANYATTVNNNIASKLPLAGGTLTGNIVMSGAQTVDGRDVSVDGSKLDGIEASADVTDTTNVVAALTAGTNVAIAANGTVSSTDTTYSVGDNGLTQKNFTSTLNTKLDGIEASADVTDTTNVVAALTAGTNVAISAGGTISSTDTNTTYSVGDGGLTQVNFTTADNTKLDGIEASANNYSHPTHPGDDFSVDSGVLSGATVISDIDINVTTDTSGHVTDANGTISTRDLTLANLGYTGATNANYITNNNQLTNGAGYITSYTNTTYSADGNYGMTLSGTAFRLEDDRRRNSTTTDIYSGNTHDYTFYDASHGIRWYTEGVEEMRLENDGDLHVDGDVIAYSTTVSDERLKTGIAPITGALSKVNQLKGCTFTYKADGRKSAGLIAQDVEKVLPSAVSEKVLPFAAEDEEMYKTVQYDQTIGLLVEAIKELTAKVEKLENK